MRDEDLAAVDGVVAVDHFQERALADAGRAAEHDAFAGGDGEGDIGDDRQAQAVAQVHGEAFEDFGNDEWGCHDTSSDLQDRRDEQLRIGFARIVEHTVGETMLDHLSVLHHHHAVRQEAGNGEVVRDDDRRKAEIVDEAANEVEQAGLHGNVETAGRLVHEDKAGAGHQIAGDLQALAHAAGEGARLIVDAVGVDFHPLQPVDGRVADVAVVAVADRHQPLADIGAGRNRHAQAVGRVLMHEAPVGPHQEPALGLVHAEEVTIGLVAHMIFDAACRRQQSRRNAVEQRRLAGAGFADDGQHFAGPKLEGHVPAPDTAAVELRDILDLEKR
ncbi:hypothetical protein RHSP_72583 [Rhizobium freirei PRF 81]|uniref:Uncharacterized protein n=1 Tax=Rhizobium freirei PRF 81 TaxID=363754 RepID=N6US13_9HYPH|nr:hypothetical protein RHSP_72583 [Rhizobium freirei PRF 81]